jgi:rubrerythrin
MRVTSEQEAMYIACAMESSAVQLYGRAMQVLEGQGRQEEALYRSVAAMRMEEMSHLQRFRSLYSGLDAEAENQLMLGAVADGILFEGGLMGAARAGLLKDVDSMLRYAADCEALSVKKYREFAENAAGEEARAALLGIAAEEERHLAELTEQSEG